MKIIALTALLALAGCGFTGTGDAFRQGVKTSGAEAMDEGLANAEWFMCLGASVGAVQRRYGKSPALADAWRTLCLGGPEVIAVPLE